MRVLSLLGPVESDRLRRTLPDSWVVREAEVGTVLADLARRSGGTILLDPSDLHDGAFDQLISRCAKAAAKLVLCHEDSLSLGATVLVESAKRAHVEILAGTIAGNGTSLRWLISLQELSIPAQVLRLVGERMLALPGHRADHTVRLFTHASLPDSVESLCTSAGCSTTTLARDHRAIGICSPKVMLTAARVARACHLAICGELLATSAAFACACSRHALDECLRSLVGKPYVRLVREGVPTDIAEQLAHRILRLDRAHD